MESRHPLRSGLRLLAALAVLSGGCASPPPPAIHEPKAAVAAPCPPCPACPACPACPGAETRPVAKPLQPARWEDLPGWGEDELGAAWDAFLLSCTVLQKRAGWQTVCAEARSLQDNDKLHLRTFIESRFVPLQVVNPDDSRDGLITGYYEPLLMGSRSRTGRFSYPLYGVPDDMLTLDFGDLYPELRNMRLRGRLEGRKVVPYYSRAELAGREAQLAGKILYWAADPLDLFFLQVQGSGRIELPDGTRARVGYADQNGHPYQSIGRWLVDKGELRLEQATMDGIKAWARANPRRLEELLNANPSFVFFRELPNQSGGPLGSMGVPLTEGRSLAADPRTVPMGAPVFLSTTWPLSDRPLNRLMVAQDTGGAIKGAVRADVFWGFGPDSGELAGRMRQKGRMWVLLPNDLAPR